MAKIRIPSKKTKKEASAFTFVMVTVFAFGLMVGYVRLNNEVTSTLNRISRLSKELVHKKASIKLLKAEVALLSRADRVTSFARENLSMVFPAPQSITLTAKLNVNGVTPYE